MNTEDRILASLNRNPGSTPKRIAKNLGLRVDEVRDFIATLGDQKPDEKPTAPTGPTPKKFSEFQDKFDYPMIVEKAIRKHLKDGQEHYYEDAEFRELCDVPPLHWRRISDSTQFTANRLKRGSVNIWAPTSLIPKMKRILSMQ